MKKLISAKLAAILLLAILGGLAVFHVLVILGIVPSGVVWGGRIADSSDNLVVLETTSLVVTIIFALIIAARVGYVRVSRFGKVVHVGMWFVFAYFTLNIIGNLASSSSVETLIFTPVSLVLAFLASRVAIEK